MMKEWDPNYEFSNDVVAAMVVLLSNQNLGVETLEHSAQYTANYTKTMTRCLAESADMWFFSKSMPRTILYGIFINTVHEYIMDNGENHKNEQFWKALQFKIVQLWSKIGEIVANIKDGDRINIDEYHEMFRKDLDA